MSPKSQAHSHFQKFVLVCLLIIEISWTNRYLRLKLPLTSESNLKLTNWSVSSTFWHIDDSFLYHRSFSSVKKRNWRKHWSHCHFTITQMKLYEDILRFPRCLWGFPVGSGVKASACNAGDLDSVPGSGRSPGEGNGNPLQYSCLENPMDGGAWWATVHGVAKSRTWLSEFTSLHRSL